jgi:hypothetical protein
MDCSSTQIQFQNLEQRLSNVETERDLLKNKITVIEMTMDKRIDSLGKQSKQHLLGVVMSATGPQTA